MYLPEGTVIHIGAYIVQGTRLELAAKSRVVYPDVESVRRLGRGHEALLKMAPWLDSLIVTHDRTFGDLILRAEISFDPEPIRVSGWEQPLPVRLRLSTSVGRISEIIIRYQDDQWPSRLKRCMDDGILGDQMKMHRYYLAEYLLVQIA